VVEQTPNVQYKIATADGSLHVLKAAEVVKLSKQKNRDFRRTTAAAQGGLVGGDSHDQPNGLSGSYQAAKGSSLPAPMALSGLRLDPEFAFVFPAGDIKGANTSFAPNIRVGYEALFGNFGIGGGGQVRYTWWQLPGMTKDAAWTLETQAYVRAALHISRVAIYGGASLGLDTNYVYSGMADMSKTALGLGMNLQSGIEVAATPTIAVKLGFDYHPGTDTIIDGVPGSISYYALLAGVGFRP